MIFTYRFAWTLARTTVLLVMASMVSSVELIASAEDATAEQNPQRQAEAFFAESVLPIFQQHCYECHSHGAVEVKGGLLLDSRSGWVQGGDSGPAIVQGKPDDSLLIRAVRYEDLEMPPTGQLPGELIDRLQRWVNEGAIDPRELGPEVTEIGVDLRTARQDWAFQPPVRSEIPHVGEAPSVSPPIAACSELPLN